MGKARAGDGIHHAIFPGGIFAWRTLGRSHWLAFGSNGLGIARNERLCGDAQHGARGNQEKVGHGRSSARSAGSGGRPATVLVHYSCQTLKGLIFRDLLILLNLK
ncbi:hypothetical protein, partial [Pseudomonas sp. EA_65y_Pfl1_P113]|uniref:hypothetical protein n=1 Tax=Pseudomonas sp. EA_65y_Pfl1_P113 TaxID=3088692 RepID=UPI0030DBA8CD